MNNLSAMSLDQLTMTSREIAELTGKQHKHVMRDIRTMLVELHGEGGLPKFGSSYLNEQNKAQPCFRLQKRETLILVSGYNVQMRAKIIDRWQQLENAQPTVDPMRVLNDPAAMRGLLLGYAEKLLTLEHEVGEMKPKVRALDWLATASEGSTCLRVSAKLMQMPERKFIQFAHAESFIFRAHGSGIWQGYADKIKAGFVEQKYKTILLSDGTEKTIEQVLITRAGLAKLAEIQARKMESALIRHHPIPSTRLKDHPLSKIRKELEMA